jgi:hypothetical protein
MLWVKDARQITLEEGEVNREALCTVYVYIILKELQVAGWSLRNGDTQ